MANPLVAAPQSQTTAVTGIGIAESAGDLANGVKDGSWVEFGMGALGVGLEAMSIVVDPLGTLAQYGASWLIEHVQPLKDALDWLAGNPPVIQSFSDTWANVAREVSSVAADLSSAAGQDTAGWGGEAGDAYRAHTATQADAIAGAAALADGISTGVMVMGQVVAMVRETVRDLVASLIGRLLAWLAEIAATIGLATPAVVAQAVTAVTKTVNKVADTVRKLIKTISNVAPKIRQIIDKLGEIIEKLTKLGRKGTGTPGGLTTPSSAARPHAPDLPGSGTHPSSHTPTTPDAPTPTSPDVTPSGSTSPSSAGGTQPNPTGNRSLREDAANPDTRSQEPVGRCGRREPIDMASGEMFLVQNDLELPGVLPLVLERVHVSSYRSGRLFGRSWASTLDQRLEVDERGVCYAAPDGVILVYPVPLAEPVFAEAGARWPLTRGEDGGYLLRQPQEGRTLHFGPESGGTAPLLSVLDRSGQRIDLDRDAAGVVSAVRHTGGYHVDVRTEAGRATELTLRDRSGGAIPLVRYHYTDAGDLAEVVNSSGAALRFTYDRAGRITRWDDRNGQWYGYTYDSLGRCVRTEGSQNALAGTLHYDDEQRITTETDSLGHVSTYHFNAIGQLVREVDPLGAATTSEWDRYHRLLSRTDPLGQTTAYRYDANGDLIEVTRPDGARSLVEYDARQLPITVVDADGGIWRHAHDERGNTTAITDPAGATTTYTYTDGLLSGVVDALGGVRRVRCDPAGLVLSVTDPAGGTTTYTRDPFGRITSTTGPDGAVTRMGWTVEGKPLTRTNPDGTTERWRYDAEGNEVEHVGPGGAVTRTSVTHFDLPAVETGPGGERTEYRYDTELRLVSVTDPRGLVWRYDYDAAGNLVRQQDFDGRTTTYRHDAAGRMVHRRDALGRTVDYEHDALGNLVARRHDDGTAATFERDPLGRITRARNADADVVFERDAAGRVVAESVNGRRVLSAYDLAGRRRRRVTPSGAVSEWDFDQLDRPTALRTAGRTMTFGHDRAGREVHRLLDTGAELTQAWDAAGRLTAQTLTGGARAKHRVFRHAPGGGLAAIEDSVLGTTALDRDGAGRVVGVRGPRRSEQYAYDRAANVTGDREPWRYSGTRLERTGRSTHVHDALGRMVRKQRRLLSGRLLTWEFTWDADDRMVGATTPDGVGWRYRHDALGRRISKERLAGEAVAQRVDFAWDGVTLAEQVVDGTAATTWEYAPGTFRPLTQVERARAPQAWVDQRFHAIVTDLVGTPTELVDPSGETVWQDRGTLWGAVAAPTPLRFPGQYHDPETGLHYNHHRHYDPETGRYTSPDPLGLDGGPDPTRYAADPTATTDPLGLMGCGDDDTLAEARRQRDQHAADLVANTPKRQRPPSTVTAGYDPATGRIEVGSARPPHGCAENDVANKLGIPREQVKFTEAVRPRTGEEVPICTTCQGKYTPTQFPEGTQAQPGGTWGIDRVGE